MYYIFRKSLENENTEQLLECDFQIELPKFVFKFSTILLIHYIFNKYLFYLKIRIKNINYLAISNHESSMHSNCSNCVEVGLSNEDLLSSLKELFKYSYDHSNNDKGKF